MREIVPLILHVSLILAVVSVGLRSQWSDLTHAFRHPHLLVRAFLAVNVVVPLVAALAVSLIAAEPAVRAGIVIMAVSPLAPLVPGKMIKAGAESSYAVGVYVALVLLSLIVVPLTCLLMGAIFSADAEIPVRALAMLVLTSVLVPLLAGLLFSHVWPALGNRLAPVASTVGGIGFLIVVVVLLYAAGGKVMSLVGDGSVAAIIVTVVAGIAAGHWLGGPNPTDRQALAMAAATRNPGIAGLIAHSHFNDRRVMLAVMLFLLTSIVVSTLYQRWLKRRRRTVSAQAVA